ncbi:MAG: ROK family protein [Hungatella sp.]
MYRTKIKKLTNKSRILECIFRNAPIARTDIADDTEITPATVTMTVSGLIEDHMVEELGEVTSDETASGRKRILIDVVPDRGYSIGVEFTQKMLVACITDLKGHILCQAEKAFSEELARRITDEIISMVQALLESSGLAADQIIGIGIAVPGHTDIESRHFISNLTLWQSFDADLLRQAFPYPILMENNARCMALAQYLFYPQCSPESFSFLHIGLGMFCANVIDGELFLGNNYVSGEIGHTVVNANGQPCECGKYGCLQTIASERWLLKYAKLLYQSNSQTILRSLVSDPEELTIRHVTMAYSMGDPIIGTYISEALKYLGISISNVAILMNPSKIFLHGEIFLNEDIKQELMKIIERQLLFVDSKYLNNVEILTYLSSDGAVGASALSVFYNVIRNVKNESIQST